MSVRLPLLFLGIGTLACTEAGPEAKPQDSSVNGTVSAPEPTVPVPEGTTPATPAPGPSGGPTPVPPTPMGPTGPSSDPTPTPEGGAPSGPPPAGGAGNPGPTMGGGGSVTEGTAGSPAPVPQGDAGAANAGAGGVATGGTSGMGGSAGQTASGGAGQGGSPGGGGGSGPVVNVVGETGTETIPGNGCVSPGAYENLFITLGGHTQEETDAKIAEAWGQLYNPSNNNTVYYNGPGQDESYVLDTGNNDVRSEGMSYGMMTAVQLDKQEEFDRLWAWVLNHMAQGTTGEIAWHCQTNGNKISNGGAPDGEEYMATALIFAQQRWGDTGRFDYAAEAQWVLDLIRTKYFHQDYHIVKFVSGSNNTDGSYILPAFYQTWACFDTANADFWNEAISAGRAFFQVAANQQGVIPDQSSFTGDALGGAGSDAKRCVMNIMMDWNFFAVDPWQVETYAPAFGQTMANGGDNTAAQFSCNALLGFGLPENSGKSFVDKLWDARIPTGNYRYYDGTLYMLALLHVGGAFKLYY